MDREDPQLVSRARGALLGLVAGNQLGVPTEHLGTPEAIRKAFPNGLVDLAKFRFHRPLISRRLSPETPELR